MLRVKVVDFTYFHFHFHFQFLFDLFFICLFLELRDRVKVMRSHCHTLVTSEDTITGHKTHERMISYNIGNIY